MYSLNSDKYRDRSRDRALLLYELPKLSRALKPLPLPFPFPILFPPSVCFELRAPDSRAAPGATEEEAEETEGEGEGEQNSPSFSEVLIPTSLLAFESKCMLEVAEVGLVTCIDELNTPTKLWTFILIGK